MNENQTQSAIADVTEMQQEGWRPSEMGKESAYDDATEMARRMIDGDKREGYPERPDPAGDVPLEDTPTAREEATTNEPAWRPTDASTGRAA